MRPIFFSLGPIAISSFGFFVAIAFLLAAFLIWKFSQEELLFSKTPIDEEALFDGIFIFVLGSFFGARLVFVFSHFQDFGTNFLQWILIRETSGFSFLAGFLIGAILLFFFSRKRKLDFWDVFDLFSLGGSAALSLAFMGAFLDGTGAGAETSLGWGVLFAGFEKRRHPVQLLAIIFFLVLFLILKRVRVFALKNKLKNGITGFSFLALSGLIFFLLEFLREGEIYWKWIKKDQLLYLGIMLAGGACFYKRLNRSFKKDIKAFFKSVKSLRKVVKKK